MIGRRYMPPAVTGIQYQLFSRNIKRGFSSSSKPLLSAVEEAKRSIRKATSIEDIPPFTDIAIEYGALLTQGILTSFVKGYDASRKRRVRKNSIDVESLIKFDWNLQNTAAVAAFSREAFVMAGVQTEELRSALFEEAKTVFASGGTYRDWADTFSMHGFEPDNPYHLRTNYDTASNAAYSAGQWKQINENKDVFPYLRYVTMQDENVREEHWALHDLIYPVDDPFWDNYMPPNGWNCRCSVEQMMQDELPKDYSPMAPDSSVIVDPKFMNNPGKSNLLQAHLPTSPIVSWSDAQIGVWGEHNISPQLELFKTDSLTREQLYQLYAEYMGDRFVLDAHNVPIFLSSLKTNKWFADYTIADLRGRFRYLRHIDDTLTSPQETWFHPHKKRLFYLKRYSKNVVILVDIEEDNVFRAFNIMFADDKSLNKVTGDAIRRGVLLLYKK